MKHENTQPLYTFNRENPQNSEPQNGPRRGLDFIALIQMNALNHKKYKTDDNDKNYRPKRLLPVVRSLKDRLLAAVRSLKTKGRK